MSIDQYFPRIASEVMSETLNSLGAVRTDSLNPLCVRYETPSWFVECFALLDDWPCFCPRIEIGPLPELGIMSRDKQVDILHTTPEGSPLRSYNLDWRYQSQSEMRTAFGKARSQVFAPFAIPVLRSPVVLRSLVAKRSGEINAAWRTEIEQHNAGIHRSRATRAWESKNYAEFIAQIELMDPTLLSDLEKAKLVYARKHR